MEEKKYTMAELLAEEDERLKKEAELEAQQAKEKAEQLKLEKKIRYEEYLKERERKHQEYLAEKERLKNVLADKTITCKKCGKEWVWTVKEQEFYKEKGFYKPSLCKECRANMKTINNFRR